MRLIVKRMMFAIVTPTLVKWPSQHSGIRWGPRRQCIVWWPQMHVLFSFASWVGQRSFGTLWVMHLHASSFMFMRQAISLSLWNTHAIANVVQRMRTIVTISVLTTNIILKLLKFVPRRNPTFCVVAATTCARVFVTYSFETHKHMQAVLSLCRCLKDNRFPCSLDETAEHFDAGEKHLWVNEKYNSVRSSCIVNSFLVVVVYMSHFSSSCSQS